MLEHAGDPEFMLSLARGLEVLEVTARSAKPVTIAEASRATGFSRAAVRRCFHTLAVLGYVRQSGGAYMITVKAMTLSRSLVSPNSLAARAQPLLDRLRDELGESCTLGVLDEDHVHYLARAEAYRIMAIGLRVGSRLPLYNTSMGRVLLATCSAAEIDGYLARNALIATTNRTETDPVEFRAILHRVAVNRRSRHDTGGRGRGTQHRHVHRAGSTPTVANQVSFAPSGDRPADCDYALAAPQPCPPRICSGFPQRFK
jgi:IclR family pca regulon transcriptional regulator